MGNVATRQAVISILWRELFRNGQYIDDLLKQSHIVMPLLAHFQIFLKSSGVFYFKHFHPE